MTQQTLFGEESIETKVEKTEFTIPDDKLQKYYFRGEMLNGLKEDKNTFVKIARQVEKMNNIMYIILPICFFIIWLVNFMKKGEKSIYYDIFKR